MRLLCVDVGNTNVNFGIFKGKGIIKKFSLPTQSLSFTQIKHKIGKIQIHDAIISSVVPGANKILEKSLKVLIGRQPYFLGKNLKVPIENLYRKPKQVGQDRLVNAYAGIRMFGAPLIIVDFGTAVTFDIVSKNKEYLGGLIVPGLKISLEALAEKTALLPKVNLKSPREIIARDTQSSILSGLVYGFAALTDGIIKKIKNKMNKSTRVIGTGGNIHFISRYCARLDKIDPDLTLKGLSLIYGDTLGFSPKRAFRLAPRVALFLMVGFLALAYPLSAAEKNAANNNTFPSPSLLQMAWDSYNKKDYKQSMKYIDRCIAIFDVTAKRQQASLNSPIPLDKINRYWALNDVATVKFIKGKIYMDTNKPNEARTMFNDIVKHYSYAMSYDPRGWYWSVSKAAEHMLAVLDGTGVDIKDASSSYITSKAWEAYNKRDYKTAVKFANECVKLYKGIALVQQNSLSNLPKGKEANKYWALNDVGTCCYIAGLSYLRLGDKDIAKAYFSFVKDNLSFSQCWDSGGWFWSVADASAKKLRRIRR